MDEPARRGPYAGVAGLLLTGGSSRRMGINKATLTVSSESQPPPAQPQPRAETLAVRSARMLRLVADPCLEVGPGHSGLPACREHPEGSGPLAALAAGGQALRRAGWTGAVLVLATDLPCVHAPALAWLAAHRAPGSVVPLAADPQPDRSTEAAMWRAQPLCARWTAADLAHAARLVAAGARRMGDLMDAVGPTLIRADAAGGPGSAVFADADTPADAGRLGVSLPDRSGPGR